MRWLGFLTAILLCGLLAGPRSRELTPIYPEALAIRATAVVLDPRDPARRRVGALQLLGGWQFDSPSPQFTGYSGLHVDGDRITMLSDWGSVLRFRLGRFGHPVGARIDPLPGGCGPQGEKDYRDSESLTGDGERWWIGFETRHRICRTTRDFGTATGVYLPPAMRRWPRSGGAEALLRLADGRFLAFAERGRRGEAERALLLFAGDPVDPDTQVTTLRYRPQPGFAPTDAAELPDGRILVITRRFTPTPPRFTAVLEVIEPTQLRPGQVVTGTPIARFEPPVLHDNFEGVAVTREGARTVVWLLSDDNSMSWQRTYLLKFALDANAGRDAGAVRRPSSPSSRSSASAAAP